MEAVRTVCSGVEYSLHLASSYNVNYTFSGIVK